MIVLGIESSCDESAVAVVRDGVVLADAVSSQVEFHKPYGGVVPEIASRKHMENIAPLIRRALETAKITWDDVDGISATRGPGLVGALIVGLQTAKSLAATLEVPFVGVNHLRGHLLAARIPGTFDEPPEFPYIALLASGGHTGVYQVRSEREITCLGSTRDDAAGEAFDKVSKLLKLGYPGGPIIDKLAATEGPEIKFPQALRQKKSYEFSFSGVKTAVAQHVAGLPHAPGEGEIFEIARGFQRAVVEILVRKVTLAARHKQVPRVVICGGVAANRGLRQHAADVCADLGLSFFAPDPMHCTDNGSMIAYVGYLALLANKTSHVGTGPLANWPVELQI